MCKYFDIFIWSSIPDRCICWSKCQISRMYEDVLLSQPYPIYSRPTTEIWSIISFTNSQGHFINRVRLIILWRQCWEKAKCLFRSSICPREQSNPRFNVFRLSACTMSAGRWFHSLVTLFINENLAKLCNVKDESKERIVEMLTCWAEMVGVTTPACSRS